MDFRSAVDELGDPQLKRIRHRGSGIEIIKGANGGYSVKVERPDSQHVTLGWALNSSPDWFIPMTFGDVLKHAEARQYKGNWEYRRASWENVTHVYFAHFATGPMQPTLVWDGSTPGRVYAPTSEDMVADDWVVTEGIPF